MPMSPRILIMRPPTNPFLQALYIVIGGVLLIGAVLMGAVLLSIALGVALIAGLAVWVRIWWLGRKIARGSQGGSLRRERVSGDSDTAEIIDVEYTVVDQRDDDARRD